MTDNNTEAQHSHNEECREILGYEGYYIVSSLGEVRSVDRRVNNRGGKQFCKGQRINPFFNDRGYPIVNLERFGKNKKRLVSRLVAQAFLKLDIDNSKIFVCHKDDNPKNNNKDNLFLGSHEDNAMDMTKKGRAPTNGNYITKYTEEQMREIIRDPITLSKKCKKYNIHRNTISNYKRKILTSKE